MSVPDAISPPHQPAPRSRERSQPGLRHTLERVPTIAYLALIAVVVLTLIAIFGGFRDGQKTYASVSTGDVIDLGIADVTIDRVRLHATDYYGDPAEQGEFLTLRMTVTNTSDSTFAVSELITIGTMADPVYGVEAIAIDEPLELDYPSIRTVAGDTSVQLGPRLTQTYDVTFPVLESVSDREQLSLVFAPSQYTPNKFLRDTSDGYYETLPTVARGEFVITDETGTP